jgi:hypothetical protein
MLRCVATSPECNLPGVEPDLDAIAADLADVETALGRLDAGTYWTDEVTGETLPDDALADRPVTRRSPPPDPS